MNSHSAHTGDATATIERATKTSKRSKLARIVSSATAVGVLSGLVLAAPAPATAPATTVPATPTAKPRVPFAKKTITVGYSAQGRKITAKRQGPADAPYVLLALGQMHGSEPKGQPVIRALRALKISAKSNVQIWSISTMNPDGAKRGSRSNARGVDLNRNFPTNWKRTGKGTFYSGKSRASERETKAVMKFVDQLKPNAVLSFHQHANTVFSVCSKTSRAWVRRTGKVMRLPVPNIAKANCKKDAATYNGTFNEWFVDEKKYGVFATVELPTSRRISNAAIKRYAKNTRTLAYEVPRFVS